MRYDHQEVEHRHQGGPLEAEEEGDGRGTSCPWALEEAVGEEALGHESTHASCFPF